MRLVERNEPGFVLRSIDLMPTPRPICWGFLPPLVDVGAEPEEIVIERRSPKVTRSPR